ncbi:MAG TPA: hypothetical protein VFY27_07355, partial [Woeseiaceae bacterium]|nr:hypothetical protein [Woeseiaceae bacterium]
MGIQRRVDGGGMIPGKEASLRLSGPIPELRQTQHRVARQVALKSTFIKPFIVEAAECRSQPTQRSDNLDLRSDEVDHEAEARSPGKLETILGFRLYIAKPISHCQEIRDQLVPAICRERKITNPVRGVE